MLKKGSKRAAGWVSGSLPRSTHYISSWRVSIILPVISMGLSSPEPPPPFLKLLLSTSSFHLPSQLLWRSHSVLLLLVFFSSSTCQSWAASCSNTNSATLCKPRNHQSISYLKSRFQLISLLFSLDVKFELATNCAIQSLTSPTGACYLSSSQPFPTENIIQTHKPKPINLKILSMLQLNKAHQSLLKSQQILTYQSYH